MIETTTFLCSICSETSTDICVYCTKDTCANHRCLRCMRCSDCCECEVPLTAGEPEFVHEEPLHEQPMHEQPVHEEPLPSAETPAPAEVPAYIELQPEVPGVAAIVVPEPQPELVQAPPPPSAVEQATTQEELVRALPELFAAEPEPPDPTAERHSDAEHKESSDSES